MSSSKSQEQSVKDRLKTKRDKLGISFEILEKKFFIDAFLKRLSQSKFSSAFVWKGGFVLSAITGISKRTTVDLDALVHGIDVDKPTLTNIMETVVQTEDDVGPEFILVDITPIREERAYQGLRVRLAGKLGQMHDNFHLDVATGETLVPAAISWNYTPLLGDEKIPIFRYQSERILGEKLQTVLERSIANTQMKDFYDIYIISKLVPINDQLLAEAFRTVMTERHTLDLWNDWDAILALIESDKEMLSEWKKYVKNQTFVGSISFEETLTAIANYFKKIHPFVD